MIIAVDGRATSNMKAAAAVVVDVRRLLFIRQLPVPAAPVRNFPYNFRSALSVDGDSNVSVSGGARACDRVYGDLDNGPSRARSKSGPATEGRDIARR